jgi:hypothetical protein
MLMNEGLPHRLWRAKYASAFLEWCSPSQAQNFRDADVLVRLHPVRVAAWLLKRFLWAGFRELFGSFVKLVAANAKFQCQGWDVH